MGWRNRWIYLSRGAGLRMRSSADDEGVRSLRAQFGDSWEVETLQEEEGREESHGGGTGDYGDSDYPGGALGSRVLKWLCV